MDLLSQGYSEKEYVFSQFIAGYCESLGFDGIGYRSKYARKNDVNKHNGINYTFFNFEKCRAVSSKLYSVRNTSLEIKKVDALLKKGMLDSDIRSL